MRYGFSILIAVLLVIQPVWAVSIVLDDEFSAYCRKLVAPLRSFLPNTGDASFVMVVEDTLNAFVTSENVVHVHSGLFLKATDSNDIQGVLAHELGHIASKHILQREDQARVATLTALAGVAVGVMGAMAGSPQAAVAGAAFGQAGGIAQLLKFSRTQEQEADQRAIAALHGAGLSAKGMVNTFERLRVDGQLEYGSIPPYLVTHPLPQERLQSLQYAVNREKVAPVLDPGFSRIQAKVFAISHTPGETLRRYTDDSAPSLYARALAFVGQGKLKEAEGIMGVLARTAPEDPFYAEVAAQIDLQQGRLEQARQGFAAIIAKHPTFHVVRFQLAEILRNQGKAKEALGHYITITRAWPVWAEPWRGAGLAYGMLGNLPMSHVALAQAAIYGADRVEAQAQLDIAKTYLRKTPNAEAQSWVDILEGQLQRNKG